MTATASAAGATAATAGEGTAPRRTTHETGAADRHTTHGLAAIRMLGQRGVFHALTHLKTLGLVTFKLGDGFVNVGGHEGERWSGVKVLGFRFRIKKKRAECDVDGGVL